MRAHHVAAFLAAGAAVFACRAGERVAGGEAEVAVVAREPAVERPLASFDSVIAPILASRCVACHGERKQKGELRLDAREALLAGGESGAVIVAGDPHASELVRRVRLPLDDPDHMPPDDKPQLEERQLRALEAWVAAGAAFDGHVAALEPFLVAPERRAPVPEPRAEALEALRRALVHVEAAEPGSHGLRVDFAAVAASSTGSDLVALLAPVRESVVDLSLARASLGEPTAGRAELIELLAALPNLRRLDLRACSLEGAALAPLARHPRLEELVLAGNRLDEASVRLLASTPSLRRMFVWGSGLAPDALARLRVARESLVIDAGDAPLAAALEVEPAPTMTKDAAPGSRVAAAPINTACPVSGAPVDPAHVIDHDGRRIGFCCPNCPAKFLADPASFAPKLP